MPRLSKPPAIPTTKLAPKSPSISSNFSSTAPRAITNTTKSANQASPASQNNKPNKSTARPYLLPSTNTSGHTEITTQPTAQAPPSPPPEPSFICTICWQAQVPPSKPRLLGTSSRIVCRPCWKAVLDLSICWVCGECIVRGDEVVSLGWCFWHRGCFGCLVCGTRIELRGFEDSEGMGGWGAWDDVGRTSGDRKNDGYGVREKRKRMIGIELDTVPLCPNCEVETAEKPYMEVVEKGLETVSRFDGGLSRARLEMLSEEREETKMVSRLRWKRSRFRGSSGLERELKRFINGSTSRWSEFIAADDPEAQKALIKHAAEMGISADGNVEDEHSQSDNEMADFGQTNGESQNNIYVSILDPIGEPAFKPSKTKPLPKWMSLLPHNVYQEREQQQKASTSEPCLHSHEMERLDGGSTSVDSRCLSESNHDEDMSTAPLDKITPKVLSRTSTAPASTLIDIPDISKVPRKGRVTISVDLKRENANGVVDHRESTYTTLPEYASRFFASQKTPYTLPRRPSMPGSETTSYFSHRLPKDPIPEQSEDPCCLLDTDVTKPESSPDETVSNAGYINLPPDSSSPFVIQSSEYLDKYQPKSAVAKYERYVAKEPEPVIERIKRQKVGKRSMVEVAEEAAERRSNAERSVKLGREEYGLDPRREDLKRELRNLFCEE